MDPCIPYRAYFPDLPAACLVMGCQCPVLRIVLRIFLASNSRVLVERPDGGFGGLRWAITAFTNSQPKHQPFLLQKSLLTFHRDTFSILLLLRLLLLLIIATYQLPATSVQPISFSKARTRARFPRDVLREPPIDPYIFCG